MPKRSRRHARARRTTAVLLAGLVLAACSDDALVSRVASLESSQDRLRETVTELQGGDAPDDGIGRVDALAVEVEGLLQRVDGLAEQVSAGEEALAGAEETLASIEGQQLDADDRLTALELRQDELAGALEDLQALRGQLANLTDRVSSLEVQLEAHRDDPVGHG